MMDTTATHVTAPASHSDHPHVQADLILLHAPSVFDFRERDDMLFAYLSDSDSVNVTSIYEMYPLGFFSLRQHLREQGYQAEIVNVASLMLMYAGLNVDALLAGLEAPIFGLDLHWLVHCHGAIELAKRVKAIHPDSLVIFGGISATYYADQLIAYPAVDVVVKGYDTLEPVAQLVRAVKRGERTFAGIPNVVYKTRETTVSTPFSHKPAQNYNDATVDWSAYAQTPAPPGQSKLIMTLPNTGCAYDCPWCGGSRYATRRIMGIEKTLVTKDHRRIRDELRTMSEAAATTSIYALQCYSESKARLNEFLDGVKEVGFKSIFVEQYRLTDSSTLAKMAQASQTSIMLSPESHDLTISKLAGRGNYSMAELEDWLPRALDAGIATVMVWFFIGMPHQDRASVLDTVTYCESLMRAFPGSRVLPLLCPMVPFLDPGSRFYEEPARHGYRIFHHTLEEHRQAMVNPLWYQRLNYETEWLSRHDLQDVTYEAIARLVAIKGELGLLPASICAYVLKTIEETTALLAEMERALDLDGVLPTELRSVIRRYNNNILACSSDQIVPLPRTPGGRWYDDFTVPAPLIAAATFQGFG